MLTELSALLDLLKAKGVSHFEGAYTEKGNLVKLAFASSEPPDATADARPVEPLDMCKCGHPLAEHQGGLCMHGCDEEKCL